MYARTRKYRKVASSAPKGNVRLLENSRLTFLFSVFSSMVINVTFKYVAPCYFKLPIEIFFHLHSNCNSTCNRSIGSCLLYFAVFAFCKLTQTFNEITYTCFVDRLSNKQLITALLTSNRLNLPLDLS